LRRRKLAPRKNAGVLGAIPILIVVLKRNIVLRDLARTHFPLVGVGGILHAFYDACFKRLPFFQQLSGAFRIRTFHDGQAAEVAASSPGRAGAG